MKRLMILGFLVLGFAQSAFAFEFYCSQAGFTCRSIDVQIEPRDSVTPGLLRIAFERPEYQGRKQNYELHTSAGTVRGFCRLILQEYLKANHGQHDFTLESVGGGYTEYRVLETQTRPMLQIKWDGVITGIESSKYPLEAGYCTADITALEKTNGGN